MLGGENDNDHNNIGDVCGDDKDDGMLSMPALITTLMIAAMIAECLVPATAAALLFHLAIMSGRRHTVAPDEIRLVLVLFSRFVVGMMVANVVVVIINVFKHTFLMHDKHLLIAQPDDLSDIDIWTSVSII